MRSLSDFQTLKVTSGSLSPKHCTEGRLCGQRSKPSVLQYWRSWSYFVVGGQVQLQVAMALLDLQVRVRCRLQELLRIHWNWKAGGVDKRRVMKWSRG